MCPTETFEPRERPALLDELLDPLPRLLLHRLDGLLDLGAQPVGARLGLTALLAQLGPHAAAVLLDEPVGLHSAAADDPLELAAAPAQLAHDAGPTTARLAERTVAGNAAATLEPSGAPP